MEIFNYFQKWRHILKSYVSLYRRGNSKGGKTCEERKNGNSLETNDSLGVGCSISVYFL